MVRSATDKASKTPQSVLQDHIVVMGSNKLVTARNFAFPWIKDTKRIVLMETSVQPALPVIVLLVRIAKTVSQFNANRVLTVRQ